MLLLLDHEVLLGVEHSLPRAHSDNFTKVHKKSISVSPPSGEYPHPQVHIPLDPTPPLGESPAR